jgi:hypothetical protein
MCIIRVTGTGSKLFPGVINTYQKSLGLFKFVVNETGIAYTLKWTS